MPSFPLMKLPRLILASSRYSRTAVHVHLWSLTVRIIPVGKALMITPAIWSMYTHWHPALRLFLVTKVREVIKWLASVRRVHFIPSLWLCDVLWLKGFCYDIFRWGSDGLLGCLVTNMWAFINLFFIRCYSWYGAHLIHVCEIVPIDRKFQKMLYVLAHLHCWCRWTCWN